MRKKQVWKYYCDFCKKSGCSKHHIEKHEKGCTLNPNRECGLCKIADVRQPAMEKMLSVLPIISNYMKTTIDEFGLTDTNYVGYEEVIAKGLNELRNIASECPACILAALRQAKIPVPLVTGFDYKKEMDEFWKELNKEEIHHKY